MLSSAPTPFLFWVAAGIIAPSAPLVSILYCHGAKLPNQQFCSKLSESNQLIIDWVNHQAYFHLLPALLGWSLCLFDHGRRWLKNSVYFSFYFSQIRQTGGFLPILLLCTRHRRNARRWFQDGFLFCREIVVAFLVVLLFRRSRRPGLSNLFHLCDVAKNSIILVS